MSKNVILKDKTGVQLFPATTAEQVYYDGQIDIKQALGHFVTPEMYGAVSDGVTDDSTAFQAAVNSGKNVYLGSGSYAIKNISISQDVVIYGNAATINALEQTANSNQFANVFTASNADVKLQGIIFNGLGEALTTTTDRFISLIKVNGGNAHINHCKFYNFDTLNQMISSDLGINRRGSIFTSVNCESVKIIDSTFEEISGDEFIWIISSTQSGRNEITGCKFDTISSNSINILHGDVRIENNVFYDWNSSTSIFNFNGTNLIASNNRFYNCVSSDVFDCYEVGYMRMNNVVITNNILYGCADLRFANLCADSILISGNQVSCGTFVRVANLMAVQSVFPFDNSTAKQIESVIITDNYIDLFETNTTGNIASGMQIMYREGISETLPDNTQVLKNLLIVNNTIHCNPSLVKAELAGGYKSGFVFAFGNKIDSIRIKNNTIINMPKALNISSGSTMMCYIQNYYDKSIGYFEFDDLVIDRDESASNTIFYFMYFRNETGYSPTVPAVAAVKYGGIYFTENAVFSDPRRWGGSDASHTTVNEYSDPYAS